LTGRNVWLDAATNVVSIAAQCAIGAIDGIAWTVFYFDLRVRREAFDLEQQIADLEYTPPGEAMVVS
jgi:hypothetical protein